MQLKEVASAQVVEATTSPGQRAYGEVGLRVGQSRQLRFLRAWWEPVVGRVQSSLGAEAEGQVLL